MGESLAELVILTVLLAGAVELDHGNLEIVQSTVNQTVFFLVMNQEMVP
jgi:hypothetical protein